jgi:nicotinate-nucleotide adenylyltransferase
MARIAFADVAHAVFDEREIHRSGPTYTVDTLHELCAEHPHAELFLVMGEDQAASFTRWRDWAAVARMATLCVARREPSQGGQPPLALPPGVRSVELELPILPDSATEVRQRLTAGQDIAELVAPEVARYIAQHRLYQTP